LGNKKKELTLLGKMTNKLSNVNTAANECSEANLSLTPEDKVTE
jgi:hypothetical protein